MTQVKAEVRSAGEPLATIANELIPESKKIVRENRNGNSDPSSTAYNDATEVSLLDCSLEMLLD